MQSTVTHVEEVKERMASAGLPALAVRSFAYYYEQLVHGETGLIPEETITPVSSLPDYEALDAGYREKGEEKLQQTVFLKLNGGLGTGMGLQQAKSLLQVRGEDAFLDIIIKQAIHWQVPLVLMNSFATQDDSRAKLRAYEALQQAVPFDFLQHKVPKIDCATLKPVSWPAVPSLAWCPPGHGDIYTALVTTGMLEALLQADMQYLFVSNSDNLGAVMDPFLLGYFSDHGLPFMMEVADRTFSDRKGGHLAMGKDGGFLLRESAQCPKEDADHFQDIERHRYFNTNNLWINLKALDALIKEKDGLLGLPMIRNPKTVDPRDPSSTPVYQLETAMGAAIAVFDGAGAIRVPRTRFAPVKTTNELLAVQSDAYVMKEDFTLVLHPDRNQRPCVVALDREIYKTVDALKDRFPHGPPSLIACSQLAIEGDVHFGDRVKCEGEVVIRNTTSAPAEIEPGAVLSGERIY